MQLRVEHNSEQTKVEKGDKGRIEQHDEVGQDN
jgi:hypothetical protein